MEIPFSYKALETYFEEALPEPEKFVALITQHSFEVAEVVKKDDDDTIITVDILPNRAHDASSYYFFAKEVAAISGKKVKPVPECKVDISDIEPPQISIEDTGGCNRYCLQKIENVEVKESPDWLKDILIRIGQKPINNIVDATNFVLWSYNQPTHAFDADKIEGEKISVRHAQKDEKITTLDGKEVVFGGSELVIADEESPIAIAGVKGGNKAEVTNKTTSIILESANFDPVSVRKTSRKHGIVTDSSKRFEHHISPELVRTALELLTHMVINLAGTSNTKVSEIVDKYPNKQEKVQVQVSVDTVNKILGIDITDKDIAQILTRLQFEHVFDSGVFSVTAPSERLDIKKTEDLVEEIGRIYGYNNIEAQPIPEMDFSPQISKEYFTISALEDTLLGEGFSQIETYALQKKGDIEIANPLARDKGALRKNMARGFKDALSLNTYNMDLLGLSQVKLFEIGTVFTKDGEETHFALGIKNGKLYKGKKDEEIYLDTVIESLNSQLGTVIHKKDGVLEKGEFGLIFEINISQIDITPKDTYKALDGFMSAQGTYQSPSSYPFVIRDIAVFIPANTSKEELEKLIKEKAGELLKQKFLFDVYEKESQTSYAYRLVFQSYEKTLTDEEVGNIMAQIEAEIGKKEDWSIR